MKSMKQRLLAVFVCLLITVGGTAYAEDNQTLVILGDSISAGYGLKADEGWVALLQQRVNQADLDIEVVNESISGEVTAGGLARLPGILERHSPDLLVIELGGNDGLRGLSPKVMTRNLKQMMQLAQAQGVEVFLFGMKLPPNYGKAFNRLFEQAFADAAEAYQVPLLPFFLEGVGGFNELMQADRIHPNQEAQQQLLENAWEFLAPFLKQKQGNA